MLLHLLVVTMLFVAASNRPDELPSSLIELLGEPAVLACLDLSVKQEETVMRHFKEWARTNEELELRTTHLSQEAIRRINRKGSSELYEALGSKTYRLQVIALVTLEATTEIEYLRSEQIRRYAGVSEMQWSEVYMFFDDWLIDVTNAVEQFNIEPVGIEFRSDRVLRAKDEAMDRVLVGMRHFISGKQLQLVRQGHFRCLAKQGSGFFFSGDVVNQLLLTDEQRSRIRAVHLSYRMKVQSARTAAEHRLAALESFSAGLSCLSSRQKDFLGELIGSNLENLEWLFEEDGKAIPGQ